MDDKYNDNLNNNHNQQEESIWQQYLSIDEKKSSTLQICLVVSLLFAGYNYIKVGDITANLATIITAIIYAIAGINASNVLGNYLNRGNQSMNNNQMGNSMTGLNGQPSPKSGQSQINPKI